MVDEQKPSPFPRLCQNNAIGGNVWCHGFFNGYIDLNGQPTNYNGLPGPVALIERADGSIEVVGVRWMRFVK